MLRGQIEGGTASRARQMGRSDLARHDQQNFDSTMFHKYTVNRKTDKSLKFKVIVFYNSVS